jgi:hypothetical protein
VSSHIPHGQLSRKHCWLSRCLGLSVFLLAVLGHRSLCGSRSPAAAVCCKQDGVGNSLTGCYLLGTDFVWEFQTGSNPVQIVGFKFGSAIVMEQAGSMITYAA